MSDMEEIKKRKLDTESKLQKESFPLSSPAPDLIVSTTSNENDEPTDSCTTADSRREDLNTVVVEEISAETLASKMTGGGSLDGDSRSPEQNSSGFCDEMGLDDKDDVRENADLTTDIFQTDSLSFSDRLEAYSDMLGGCNDVHHRMYEYLSESVVFSGWRAIWKVEGDGRKALNQCSILIEVDAATETLVPPIKSKVHLVEPFCCIMGDVLCEGKAAELKERQIREILKDHGDHVGLINLYPIFDDSGAMDDTALAIEHARFFYQQLWRTMDDEEDVTGSSFLDKYLKQRLKFYYDVQDKRIPAQIISKHKNALAEYKAKCEIIKDLQSQLQDGDVSDVELDMNESRIAVDILGLHDQVETLNKTLDKLESPFLRSLMNIPAGFLTEKSPETRSMREDKSVRTFLIAKQLTAGMIQNLNLAPDVIIEHCRSPGDAFAQCYHGDTLLIFPGRYSGTGFYNVSQSITIKGVSERKEVVVVCEELADIFLDCQAPHVTISNLTLEDENAETWYGLVAVRPGSHVTLNECILQRGALGATVFRGGQLEMKGCEVAQIKKHGLRCKAGSSVHLSDCLIHQCGLINSKPDESEEDRMESSGQLIAGIAIEIQETDEGEEGTTLEITNSRVIDNQGTGIAVFMDSHLDEEPEPITPDVIGLLHGVKVIDLKGDDFSDNLMGEAMLARADDI